MGEKIKTFGNIFLAGSEFEVELNKATVKNGPRYVHLQNERIRLNLSEEEFVKMLSAVRLAAYKIKKMKGID